MERKELLPQQTALFILCYTFKGQQRENIDTKGRSTLSAPARFASLVNLGLVHEHQLKYS